MELLEKEEKHIGYVFRKIGDCLLIVFFVYTCSGLLLVRKIFERDLILSPVNVIACVLYLIVSIAIICRVIIVLTGRYMSVPVLHKYLSRSEVRKLFENEHFEKPEEFKGTLLENKVYVSEHWLCLYHHFVRRDKVVFMWETSRGGMHSSFRPFVINVLYGSGDTFHFDGDDWRYFHKRWEEMEIFWYFLARSIAGGTQRSCSHRFYLREITEACRKNFPTKEEKRQFFLSREGLNAVMGQIEELYKETDLDNFAFIKLIDQAAWILSEREKDDNYKIFGERYGKMREYLENLRREYVKNTLDTKKVCLNIVRMLNHGDDEELANAIAAVNSYYQEHLYSEEKRKRRRKRKF